MQIPMKCTIGDKTSGEVNIDGLGSFGSGLPSGGVMEKSCGYDGKWTWSYI